MIVFAWMCETVFIYVVKGGFLVIDCEYMYTLFKKIGPVTGAENVNIYLCNVYLLKVLFFRLLPLDLS